MRQESALDLLVDAVFGDKGKRQAKHCSNIRSQKRRVTDGRRGEYEQSLPYRRLFVLYLSFEIF